MFISHSQRDPSWARGVIPGTNMTLGRFGCTISCVADISSYFGMTLTPRDIALHCRFTSGGLLYWSSCVFEKFLFERREYGRNDPNIGAALDDPNRAVILQVADQSHWVVALGFDDVAKLLIIADPWLGDHTNMARYHNSVTGAAYFRRK